MTNEQKIALLDGLLKQSRALALTIDVGPNGKKYSPRSYRSRFLRSLEDADSYLFELRRTLGVS